jgi:hypothetical protein
MAHRMPVLAVKSRYSCRRRARRVPRDRLRMVGPPAAEGPAGLTGRARHIPHRTSPAVAQQIVACKWSPNSARPVSAHWLAASTMHAVPTRHGLARPAWLDRPIGTVIRRCERPRPGDLVHMDVKKLGRVSKPAGHYS